MKRLLIITIFFSALVFVGTTALFAQDASSATSTPNPPTNTPNPSPTPPPTSIPQSATNTPAPSTAPSLTPQNTSAPVSPSPKNVITKITKTIPPTLDPEEEALLRVTSFQEETSPAPTIPDPIETPTEEIQNSSSRGLMYVLSILIIALGTYLLNHHKQTGEWIPSTWRARLKFGKKPENNPKPYTVPPEKPKLHQF